MPSSSNLLAYNCFHDASVCYLKNPTDFFHLEEERISRKKHDFRPYLAIADCLSRVENITHVFHTSLKHDEERYRTVLDFTFELSKKIDQDVEIKKEYLDWIDDHHLFHAALGFYNSGFEDAVCISVDGAGALLNEGYEVETIYEASYPSSFEKVYQKLVSQHTVKGMGIGFVYSGVSEYLGFGSLDCGKVMGLAAYGEYDPNIKPFIIDGQIDETLWERDPNGINLIPYDNIIAENLAWRCQKDFETYMIGLIDRALEVSNNIVLSGGCALNCVANYNYLKHLPEGAKLYVEPVSTDAGTAVGMALYAWRKLTGSKEIYPIKDLYWGPQRNEILL